MFGRIFFVGARIPTPLEVDESWLATNPKVASQAVEIMTEQPVFVEKDGHPVINFISRVFFFLFSAYRSGLPDFSWYSIPKREKCTK
jgi:hypothetical protein